LSASRAELRLNQVAEDYRSDRKHQLAMGDSTMSIYTH